MLGLATQLALHLLPARFARLAKPLAIVGLILAAIVLLAIARAVLIEAIEARHSAKLEAHAQAAGRRADSHAADQREVDRARIGQEADQLNKVTSNVPQASLDDARRAYYRCVRLQQQARDRGGPPAVC